MCARAGALLVRHVKLGRGHRDQPARAIYRSGTGRRRRCANIHGSKYSLRPLRILSFTGFPASDSILTVLVITRLTTSETGPLHPAM
jgi:hypothetical protein